MEATAVVEGRIFCRLRRQLLVHEVLVGGRQLLVLLGDVVFGVVDWGREGVEEVCGVVVARTTVVVAVDERVARAKDVVVVVVVAVVEKVVVVVEELSSCYDSIEGGGGEGGEEGEVEGTDED